MRVAGAVLLGLGLAVQLRAQDRPTLRLDLRAEPREALVSVEDLLSDRFVSALESGFPLYMEYTVALREPRPLWDRTLRDLAWEYVVLYDPLRQRFTVETPDGTESLPDRGALRARLARVYVVGLLEPEDRGRLYYEAHVNARTLSDQDVDETFAWLKGKTGSPGLLDRLARKLLVEVAPLPRVELSARSVTFDVR